ncbi:Signal-induced proliferation-associated 1-like protein 1 [Chionoecetes opilio]|uniref:Signal-induced proliferation-associated 1-like protein 1 n=1 Tax=Chionoecetes opilio TaxID=41210 RepID=A0A8J5CQT6_CHIOP|nr:Signal-induced proliferation-associated 1-like protein 1 [Chionoecetes opilio]
MRKAEVMNVGPAAVLGRGTAGRAPAGLGGPVSSLDCGPLLGAVPAHSANVLNNNVEANGLEDTAANNNNNNNNNNKSSSNNNINGKNGSSSHKSSAGRRKGVEGWDGPDQGSLGYVSERVRALSISDRSRGGHGHRFGSADMRASYNERLRTGPASLQAPRRGGPGLRPGQEVGGGFVYLRGAAAGGLYRSNSSLDLEHEGEEPPPPSPLRREYGSHGSINVAAAPQEALYSILRDLQPPNQALRGSQGEAGGAPGPAEAEATSPKARSKFQRLWDRDKSSIFKKLRSSRGAESAKADNASDSSGGGTGRSQRTEANGDSDSRGEDVPVAVPTRRSAFAHYDCRSLATQFSTSQTRQLLAERVNTTTGASAAAMAAAPHHDSTEDLVPEELDPGDGRSNSLINSCPFFRNELGGEGERVVSLSRDWGSGSSGCGGPLAATNLHRPVAAATLGLLEPPVGLSHWQMTLCPYVRSPLTVEAVDQGSAYYRNYFCGQGGTNIVILVLKDHFNTSVTTVVSFVLINVDHCIDLRLFL